ncbi:MAG TPA: hypothetical protein V6C63_19180 [Allocoleopsis sp.]
MISNGLMAIAVDGLNSLFSTLSHMAGQALTQVQQSVATDAVQNAFGGAMQQWMAEHRMWGWLIQHPLTSVGLLLVLLVLLQGLLSAIAQLIQRAGWALLRSPWKLSQWLLGFSAKSFQAALAPGAKREAESKQQRLTEIVNRLEALKQEQDALLQEVKAIVASDSPQSNN